MANGVDDWVEAGGQLGEEAWQLREEGSHVRLGSDGGHEDDEGVRRPDAGPQQNVGHGNLSNLEFGALGLVVLEKMYILIGSKVN